MNRLVEPQKQLPGVCIFGTGEYYRKLEQGLKKEFRILRAFNESAPSIIRQLESLTPDAILILSPNATHYQILHSVVRLNVPVLVEKPAVVNRNELHDLEQLVQKHPRIYFSDFYVDVRALPLLAVSNQTPFYQEELTSGLRASSDLEYLKTLVPEALRDTQEITGRILEGEGPSAQMEHRPWLLEPAGGGVMLDLLCHLLILVARLFPLESIDIEQVTAGRRKPAGLPGEWDPLPTLGTEAETYCYVSGSVGHKRHFHFEVAKYWTFTERKLALRGSGGEFALEFSRTSNLRYRLQGEEGSVALNDDYYQLTAKAFRCYVESGILQPHNYEETKKVLSAIFNCRANYETLRRSALL